MLSVILIGISLSMDAFAVSVTNGIAMRPFKTSYALWHGLYFGAFQFLMPLAGYVLGSTVSGYVTAVGHYVSFALLAFIGGKMILEAVRGGEEGSGGMAVLSHKRLLALAVATSIDALAIGISFACTGYKTVAQLSFPLVVIGVGSFLFSVLGNRLGIRFGIAIRRKLNPELFGGLVLIFIGIKVLLTHILNL